MVYLGEDQYGNIEYERMMGWKAKTLKMWRHPSLANVRYGEDIVEFLLDLQDLMEANLGLGDGEEYELPICTEHKRDGNMFCGHPDYRGGGPWRD